MAVVYHWKHGWIPLDHTAALSKAKGNHERAAAMLADAHGSKGIQSRQDLAKALTDLHNLGTEADRSNARHEVLQAANRLNAQDLLPRSMELDAKAMQKRAEAERIAGSAGVADTAAARLNSKNLAAAHRNTDSQLRRYSQATGQAEALEHKAALARARETEASRQHFTREELAGARAVHDRFGWHEVVKVNGKTVTVKTPYSWTETIPHDKIDAVAHPHPTEPGKLITRKPGSNAA